LAGRDLMGGFEPSVGCTRNCAGRLRIRQFLANPLPILPVLRRSWRRGPCTYGLCVLTKLERRFYLGVMAVEVILAMGADSRRIMSMAGASVPGSREASTGTAARSMNTVFPALHERLIF